MRRTLGKVGCWLGLVVAGLLGCQTSKPELKPVKQPEVLNVPPSDPRYNSPGYPKEAFNKTDPKKGSLNAVMPAKGSFGPGAASGGGF